MKSLQRKTQNSASGTEMLYSVRKLLTGLLEAAL